VTARSGGRRRGSGEGGVYQRASDGRWVGVVDLGWIDGKRRRRTVYGATRAEAVAKLDQLRAERRAGRDLAVQAPTLSGRPRKLLGSWGERRRVAAEVMRF